MRTAQLLDSRPFPGTTPSSCIQFCRVEPRTPMLQLKKLRDCDKIVGRARI